MCDLSYHKVIASEEILWLSKKKKKPNRSKRVNQLESHLDSYLRVKLEGSKIPLRNSEPKATI